MTVTRAVTALASLHDFSISLRSLSCVCSEGGVGLLSLLCVSGAHQLSLHNHSGAGSFAAADPFVCSGKVSCPPCEAAEPKERTPKESIEECLRSETKKEEGLPSLLDEAHALHAPLSSSERARVTN